MSTKPQIETITDPQLARGTRVKLRDGREAHIADHTHTRASRFFQVFPSDLIFLPQTDVARAWMPVETIVEWKRGHG